MDLEFFRRLTEPLAARAARARNRALLEAAMASAALVAKTHGKTGLAQRLMLDQILDSVDSLRGNDPHVAVEIFEDFATALRDNPAEGRERALSAIAAFAGAPDSSRLLLHISRAMAGAEGTVGAEARAGIAAVAGALRLPGEAPSMPEAVQADSRSDAGPRVIVLGNGKGGTGKSTTAMHLAVALMAAESNEEHGVGTIDLDGHQGTLSCYLANRARHARTRTPALPMPIHRRIAPSNLRDRELAHAKDRAELDQAMTALAECRYIIVDTPGSHDSLSRLGHEHADILITPLNDSFLDIDVLARIDRERREVLEPSVYGRMVLDEKARRAEQGRADIDWIVMRNRLAHIDARNTREVDALLRRLGGRMGFRLHAGISERVVFRELFYQGLTLLDPPPADWLGGKGAALTARTLNGHRHARRELDELVAALRLPVAAAPDDQPRRAAGEAG